MTKDHEMGRFTQFSIPYVTHLGRNQEGLRAQDKLVVNYIVQDQSINSDCLRRANLEPQCNLRVM